MAPPSCLALIPARSGSVRVPDKNILDIAGHPMMAYTIGAAHESGVFTDILVSTDSEAYAEIARRYGARVPFLRPASIAGSTSPDIEWVRHTLESLADQGRIFDCFSILRPTSPLRQPATIRRAWETFLAAPAVDSLRAVERCGQHPGKMWRLEGDGRMVPFLPQTPGQTPSHSRQYADLPEVYVQNASLEIAWSRVVREQGTIAGESVRPFFTQGYEGFDVNQPLDVKLLELLLQQGEASLPPLFDRRAAASAGRSGPP